jgi:predicted transposase YbfD/YdcC
MKLVEIFEDIPDFRSESRISHHLSSILVTAFCAVLSGADDFEEIAEYGVEKEDFLRQVVPLPNGIPSHDTFRRVFQNMDTKAFEKCLQERAAEVVGALEGCQVNIDGKVLRATGERGKKTAAICIVSAWVSEHCVSLGQVKTDRKSNEKTAIPDLLEAIDVRGALVSIDAMGCDKKVAALIRSNGGDYLLALKENQKGLYEEARDWMGKRRGSMDVHSETDYVGGRIEKRTTYVCDDLTYIDESLNWADSKSIIMVEAERSFKNGEGGATFQTRFYISSRAGSAGYFAGCSRRHWSVENQLHWYLDVVFNEDRQRLREGNAPENMAAMRKLSLQTLLKNKGKKSLKTMRKKVAWNDSLLVEMLKNI